ncbi:MAG: hypothetical protein ACRDHJ_09905 [Actinomycetota bacterium]
MDDPTLAERRLDRRRFLLGSAGAVAGATLASSVAWPRVAVADDEPKLRLLPPPKPIPGGLPIGLPPPYDFIHIFLPGPETVTLPLSGLTLMGLNVEPSTITDLMGATALAYIIGTATGTDGVEYGLEADIRAFEGKYFAADGSTNRGTFAMI